MKTVSDVLGNSGSPITVTMSDGRTLVFSRLTQKVKTAVEQHLKALARNQVMEDRHEFADGEFELAYGSFLKSVSSGDFKYGGRVYMAFIGSGAGGIFLTQALARWSDGKELTEPEITNLSQHPDDKTLLTLGLRQAIEESFPKAVAPDSGPGTSAPAGQLPL